MEGVGGRRALEGGAAGCVLDQAGEAGESQDGGSMRERSPSQPAPFAGGQTEVQIGQVTCPRSHSTAVTEHIEMTTATPLGGNTIFSLNMTTRGEDFLYKSSGAIIAAVVVVVIIIFTVVLILLKMYNRKMRTRRELEPKGPKPASPSALGANSNSSQQPATVTFSPVDVHMETR
uniref:DCD domain-containing protein n=1 Tax=Capra hircus TaxID=9925 RepID=A0A8C2N5Y2_CAPHI